MLYSIAIEITRPHVDEPRLNGDMTLQIPKGSWRLEIEHILNPGTDKVKTAKMSLEAGKVLSLDVNWYFNQHKTSSQCLFIQLCRDKIDD